MKIVDCEQRSPEWFEARLGKVTASRVGDAMDTLKNGNPGMKRKNYARELLAERITGVEAEFYVNKAMQWGTDHEDEARNLYAFQTDADGEDVGLVLHPWIDNAAASPDWLVGSDGLVEIKCPNSTTHLDTLLANDVPTGNLLQIHFQMICTGRDWCDFVSFDPRMPGEMSMFIKRVHRDADMDDQINLSIEAFLDEVDAAEAAIRDRYTMSEAAE
tara:strand:- start:635 stop:1282 length:648 start_codon:yes stop_codon:yes gene_type:complete